MEFLKLIPYFKLHMFAIGVDFKCKTQNDMATQLADSILKDGEWMNLFSNPLEQYWITLNRKRPAFYSQSDCKRGYIACWEIRDNQLFLLDVEGSYERRVFVFFKKFSRYTLESLFPKSIHKPIKATWVTGKLRIPIGKMTLYDHNGYNSRFEKEQIITVDQGNVLKIVVLDYVQQALIIEDDEMIRTK